MKSGFVHSATTMPGQGRPEIPTRAALIDLASPICACGARKKRRQTFCRRDFFRMPKGLRDSTYNPMGDGYVEAYARCLEFLGLESPEMKRLAARAAESEAAK